MDNLRSEQRTSFRDSEDLLGVDASVSWLFTFPSV